ncbi:phosphate regulon sensor histidine kinase PhoR [Usitatibacter palustris]|uniref:Phosphate regulon sensor protein PhoR n=1 Tax=Usitatibacter palustris TaxID=2732487 RepID=A0A6M4HAJ1_9PROT|nr:phosphate regulon sensor histidine kinase PhoR [Usitatibacter palustris]QJR16819.1 Phosphate regulon sensor protein PhoR [Usitatibacter palustris]
MNDWLGRLILLAALAGSGGLLVGLIFGGPAAALFLFFTLVGIAALHYRNQERLARWIANPNPDDVPDIAGSWGEIFARLYRHLKLERASQASLTAALSRFRDAAEAMPDGVIVLDAENHIEWLNPAAEKHFNFSLERDRLQPITNLLRQPALLDYIQGEHFGDPMQLKDIGEGERIFSVQLVPYGHQQKLLLSRDITRWERLESMRRDFIANVSHELRTPLTVMKGFLETLTDARESDDRLYRRSMELMTEQAERMQRLVEDLLMLSRLEDSGYPLREEPIDVAALVRSVLMDAEALNRGQHRLHSDMARTWIHGSRDELRSAFSNLLSNAIRYTPPGGEIHVTWKLEDGKPVFAVKDNGEGIAPEHVPRLTERFYRVDRSRSRSTGGTGLGLAIVKHVLQRHQAHLEIDSEPNKGSTFSCVFPAARITPASATKAEITPIRAA